VCDPAVSLASTDVDDPLPKHGRVDQRVLCEVYVRLRAVGLVNGQSYLMPVTQAELGDATGMSTVHVNRTLQELRRDGLISTPRSGQVGDRKLGRTAKGRRV
jgi:CRP-like cAMP-binding protein